MKRFVLIFVALLCALAFSSKVRACQCVEYGTPTCAAFWRADAVFVGHLVEIKSVKKKSAESYSYRRLRSRKIRFRSYGDFEYTIQATDEREKIAGESDRVIIQPQGSSGLKLLIRRILE